MKRSNVLLLLLADLACDRYSWLFRKSHSTWLCDFPLNYCRNVGGNWILALLCT